MVLEGLGNILKKSIDKIASAVFVDKKLIDSIVKDLQRALIMADVNIELVKELSDKIKKAGEKRVTGIEKKEYIIKLLNDEITSILGGKKQELKLGKKEKILLIGLYGTGKTTTISKLGSYYKKRGKKVAFLGLDVHRPAAPEQLEQLGKKNDIPVFTDKTETNPLKIYKKFEKNLEDYDLILIDSAGRDALEKSLIKEIKELSDKINPTNTILVIAADIGQTAKRQVEEFKKACNITGVIITRMDSSAKGGGALTACAQTNSPVYFIGTGEKPADLELFNPQSFISRLLGMGDLETLIEKVKSATDEKEQRKLQEKLQEGKLSLKDMVEQTKSMNSIGSFSKLKDLIPGMGKFKADDKFDQAQEKVKKWEHIIKSMTPNEIENPEVLEKQTSRITRIANGSGTTTSEIRQMLKQYKMIKELASSAGSLGDISDPNQLMSNKQLMKLAKKFGKKKTMRF